MTMIFIKNDGGRAGSKRLKQKNDCVIRAFALALQSPYDEIYDQMKAKGRACSQGTAKAIWQPWINQRAQKHSFPAIKGEKRLTLPDFCRSHPRGRWIIQMAGHLTVVIDGTVMDTFQPRETGCIYAAWEIK